MSHREVAQDMLERYNQHVILEEANKALATSLKQN